MLRQGWRFDGGSYLGNGVGVIVGLWCWVAGAAVLGVSLRVLCFFVLRHSLRFCVATVWGVGVELQFGNLMLDYI